MPRGPRKFRAKPLKKQTDWGRKRTRSRAYLPVREAQWNVQKIMWRRILCHIFFVMWWLLHFSSKYIKNFEPKWMDFIFDHLRFKKQVTSFPLNALFSESDGKRGILEELSRGQIITGKEPKMNMLDFWVFQKYSNAVTSQNPLSHAFRGIT